MPTVMKYIVFAEYVHGADMLDAVYIDLCLYEKWVLVHLRWAEVRLDNWIRSLGVLLSNFNVTDNIWISRPKIIF